MTSLSKPRILISRLSAVGDCILTMPMLCALRDQFPLAHIAWVVEPAAAPLLKNHPDLNQLIVVKKGWLRSPREFWNLRRQLRVEPFDIAIDPQSLTKSALVSWLSGAPRRVGFAPPHGREFSPHLNNDLVKRTCDHVVDHQLELLRTLGVKWPQVQFHVPRDPAAEQIAAALVRNGNFANGFAVINPGAGWDSRLWPVDRFAKIARRLGEKSDLATIVVWAGQREQQWAQQIVAEARGHAVLAPRTSLTELAALLRLARLFVGSDTGPLHLAAAVGTRCVSLHGTTRREQSGPYGADHIALQEYYQAGTSRQRRGADNAAMRAISVDKVFEACQTLLARSAPERTQSNAA